MKKKCAALVAVTAFLLAGPLGGTAQAAVPTVTPSHPSKFCDIFPWVCHR